MSTRGLRRLMLTLSIVGAAYPFSAARSADPLDGVRMHFGLMAGVDARVDDASLIMTFPDTGSNDPHGTFALPINTRSLGVRLDVETSVLDVDLTLDPLTLDEDAGPQGSIAVDLFGWLRRIRPDRTGGFTFTDPDPDSGVRKVDFWLAQTGYAYRRARADGVRISAHRATAFGILGFDRLLRRGADTEGRPTEARLTRVGVMTSRLAELIDDVETLQFSTHRIWSGAPMPCGRDPILVVDLLCDGNQRLRVFTVAGLDLHFDWWGLKTGGVRFDAAGLGLRGWFDVNLTYVRFTEDYRLDATLDFMAWLGASGTEDSAGDLSDSGLRLTVGARGGW